MQPQETNNIKKPGPADHMANERTFLAWIRTGIALMGLGFVIVKFALFLRQMAIVLGDQHPVPPGKGYSQVIGVCLVAFGAIISLLSFFRYRHIEKQLNANDYNPSQWLMVLLTVAIVTGSILLVLYLLPGIL